MKLKNELLKVEKKMSLKIAKMMTTKEVIDEKGNVVIVKRRSNKKKSGKKSQTIKLNGACSTPHSNSPSNIDVDDAWDC